MFIGKLQKLLQRIAYIKFTTQRYDEGLDGRMMRFLELQWLTDSRGFKAKSNSAAVAPMCCRGNVETVFRYRYRTSSVGKFHKLRDSLPTEIELGEDLP
jgi:hypothetical protein